MNSSTITKTAYFDVKPDTVWAFLTEKEKLKLWYHHSDKDFSEGGPYELYRLSEDGKKIPQIWGRVLKMETPSKLVYTFSCEAFPNKETTVSCVLKPFANGTQLTLTHEGVVEATGDNALTMLMALDKGWDAHLSSMRSGAQA